MTARGVSTMSFLKGKKKDEKVKGIKKVKQKDSKLGYIDKLTKTQ